MSICFWYFVFTNGDIEMINLWNNCFILHEETEINCIRIAFRLDERQTACTARTPEMPSHTFTSMKTEFG